MTATIKLSSYNMGDVTEEDFDAWAAYVAEHIDEMCGFDVRVDQFRFGSSDNSGDDLIEADAEEQRTTIEEAVREMWDRAEWWPPAEQQAS